MAKVFGRIIYDQLYPYLSDNNMITALLDATHNSAYNTDKGNVNAVVVLDLKKAFDTVEHDIRLSK